MAVGALNAWTLDMTRDKVDVTCFGDTTKQYVVGLPDTKGTFGGWWDEATRRPTTVFAVGRRGNPGRPQADAVD